MKAKQILMLGAAMTLGAVSVGGQIVAHAEAGGSGLAQVTYNVNPVEPTDPTENPEFAVLIPSVYVLGDSNLKVAVPGEVSIRDADDISKAYVGTDTVDVAVQSAMNFTFQNGGKYDLVDDAGAAIPNNKVSLSKDKNDAKVNAKLTKKGTKLASSDTLTFTYSIAK